RPVRRPAPDSKSGGSLFGRTASTSGSDAFRFDASRILVEHDISGSPGDQPAAPAPPVRKKPPARRTRKPEASPPAGERVYSRLPESDAPAAPVDPDAPTFDLERIVVDRARASVA